VFLGAAGTMTGSCYLLEVDGARVLIDCGLFQGSKTLKELNYRPFPVDPNSLSAVLLTHAHIDHSGLIPKLFKGGYRGVVHATGATRDLLACMLPDSGHIQEYEVEQLNRRRHQRGEASIEPIYTRQDAERYLAHIQPVAYGSWLTPAKGVRARFWDAGHILGSASIEVEIERPEGPLRLLFSGDLGTTDKALHDADAAPRGLDYLIVESTYGDRSRPQTSADERRERLGKEVDMALARGGNLVIPVFAVERTQELLFDLGVLRASSRLRPCQIFVDSPLAIQATQVFEKHASELAEASRQAHPFTPTNVHFVGSVEDSKHLNRIRSGAVILSASGMCEAGRIRHHLLHNLWRPDSTVLLVGYQASGTLGRILLDGAPAVQIMGQEVRVKAAIRLLDIYSAHADQGTLVRWVRDRAPIRRAIVLTHGEPMAIAAFSQRLTEGEGECPMVLQPSLGSWLSLDCGAQPILQSGTARLQDSEAGLSDWHNAYAALRLRLNEALKDTGDDQRRLALIERISKLLDRQLER
jgi:metallo-beta-lactamase family protein